MPMESLTIEGSMFYFRYIFFAMGVWYLVDNNPYLSKCLLIVSVLSLIIVCSDGMYQYFFGVNIFGNEKYKVDRLTGFFGKEPIIGRYISYLSIFTFTLIYQNYQKTKKMIISSVALLVMCEVVIFLTGERVPLLYISMFSLLIIIFIPHYRIYRIIGVLFSLLIILSILQVNPSAKSRMVDSTITQVSQTKYPYLPYTSHHEQHYISALKMFIDKPFFGIGTNSFRVKCGDPQYLYKEMSCSTHPHQFYIQILAELGVFGFLFIFSFFIYLLTIGTKQLYYLIRSNKKKQISFETLLHPMALFVYWWPLIPNMSFYNNWNNVLIMLPLGFFLKYFYGRTSNGNLLKN